MRLLGEGSLGCTVYSTHQHDNLLQSLLQTYSDIFEEPRGLPPPHHHDHRIHLLPDTTPVAIRPYRYP
jgi:hypothetical protein